MDQRLGVLLVELADAIHRRRAERRQAAAAAFERACSGDRAPGMAAVTASDIRIQRSASWAMLASAGTSGRSSSTSARPVS